MGQLKCHCLNRNSNTDAVTTDISHLPNQREIPQTEIDCNGSMQAIIFDIRDALIGNNKHFDHMTAQLIRGFFSNF